MSGAARVPPEVVFTGGGTAGHIEPALALARAYVKHGHDPETVHFIGASAGMEGGRVADAGFSITLLPARGIKRRPSAENLVAAAGLAAASAEALTLLARRRPAAVVMLGGYAGLPAALAAVTLRVPLVVVNVDAAPGAANRLVSRFAAASTHAFPDEGAAGPTVVGAPLRDEVLAVARHERDAPAVRAERAVEDGRAVVVVVGGSLGSGRLNDAAIGLARRWAARSDVTLFHLCGGRNYEGLAAQAAAMEDERLDYRLVGFEADLPGLFAIASIVVSRAGAMSVAELAAIGAPSILVPLPGAPRDHQAKNAAELARSGGALVIADEGATPLALARIIEPLLDSPDRLAEMADAARAVGRLGATEQIVGVLEDLVARRSAR